MQSKKELDKLTINHENEKIISMECSLIPLIGVILRTRKHPHKHVEWEVARNHHHHHYHHHHDGWSPLKIDICFPPFWHIIYAKI